MPFQFVLDEGEYTYYLVYPKAKSYTTEFETFRDWILSLARP
jgi:LysR family glycine cleavage system transcriptional activator